MKAIKNLFTAAALSLGILIAPSTSWAANVSEELPNRAKQLLAQFQSTEKEQSTLKTFKSQTMQKTILNALDGNPAAIHWVGLSYLTGANGFEKDERRAYGYFSAAAGLGYAPSINRIKSMYLNSENPFMALVYVNLLIGQGHSEFTPLYDEYKSLENLGPIFNEIEKIADAKREKIRQNLAAYEAAEDKTKFTISLMTSPSLVSEDKTLSDPEKLAALLPPLKETSKTIAQGS